MLQKLLKKLAWETEPIPSCNRHSFKVSDVIPYELAVEEMKKAIEKSYGRKGEDIVKMNNAAVDKGAMKLLRFKFLLNGKTIELRIKNERTG